jgi:hypothetical protein
MHESWTKRDTRPSSCLLLRMPGAHQVICELIEMQLKLGFHL